MVCNMKIVRHLGTSELPKSELSKRDQILGLLEERPSWHSGEMMAERLGISRAAVAKHVAALRAAGHGIESVSRRGHRLVVKADDFRVEDVQAHLIGGIPEKEVTAKHSEFAKFGVAPEIFDGEAWGEPSLNVH